MRCACEFQSDAAASTLSSGGLTLVSKSAALDRIVVKIKS